MDNALRPTAPTDKPTATLIAQLAIRGHAVHRGAAGDFNVCKFGLSRYCKNVDELMAFARHVGIKVAHNPPLNDGRTL